MGRKRNKKSPGEIEWKEIQSRPFRYELIEKDIEACKFVPNCPICAPILHDESSTDSKIFFPGFERIDYIPVDGEGTIDASHSLKEQELFSTLELSELYHSVGFIQRYNNGMIVSSQKKMTQTSVYFQKFIITPHLKLHRLRFQQTYRHGFNTNQGVSFCSTLFGTAAALSIFLTIFCSCIIACGLCGTPSKAPLGIVSNE